MPQRWTLGRMMLAVAAVATTLGALRSPLGVVFALLAGGVVGCGLAPWYACRGMRRLRLDLEGPLGPPPPAGPEARRIAVLVAQSYVLIWSAWFLAGVVLATAGVALSQWLHRLAAPG